MIGRDDAEGRVVAALDRVPAVVLLGARQVGKTTLAHAIAAQRPAVYLDLESPADRARLAEPELYLREHADTLVVLDEIHRAPGIFAVLRGLIDEGRRAGRRAGQYLLLGSASLDLLAQSGETLAGRVAYIELTPFTVPETDDVRRLWLRGGFPDSYLAPDDDASFAWRTDFIRTYLERDVPQLGPRIPAETLRRLWTMLAHQQGALVNNSALARSLGVSAKTVAGYLDLLVDLLLVRRLAPWSANVGKRLVRSPKLYIRDSGLTHALLGLAGHDALAGHPVVGPSWEGFVLEQLLTVAGDAAQPLFYRSAAGAEIDLVLEWRDGERWVIDVKRSAAPKLERGFHHAWDDLRPIRGLVVHPGAERYPLRAHVEAIPIAGAITAVRERM